MKKKQNIGNTAAAPIILREGSGPGVAGIVLVGAGTLAAFYFGNKFLKQQAENKAESDTSPEGVIAMQLKVVFDKWPVSDVDYKKVALQITDENKAQVYKLYRALTGRNLSDDIASSIGVSSQSSAAKIQSYNSKPGKLFSITPDNKILFHIVPGDHIRFTPGQTAPVTAYNSHFGIVLNDLKASPSYTKTLALLKANPKTVGFTVSVPIKPTASIFKVVATKELPVSGVQSADDFFKVIRPYVATKKTFTAVQIQTGINPNTKKPVFVWIDGRDMITVKPSLKGFGSIASKLI